MKFDYVIGNPPYQDETIGAQKQFAPPVYYLFLESAFSVSEKVEMIHPGRFLFNAGTTPKSWNRKMLNDPHFKILDYKSDAKYFFPSTQITGGIAISYRDSEKVFGAIDVFTPFSLLNAILKKCSMDESSCGMDTIAFSRTAYRFSPEMHRDYPEAIHQLTDGHAFDMASNIFEILPQVFEAEKPNNNDQYISMLGRAGNNREYRYIKREYVSAAPNLEYYKIIFSRADGAAGTVGNPIPARVLGNPIIEKPGTGNTESFMSVGMFTSVGEAKNALKYIQSKFARVLLGVLKTTQDITPGKWKYVPLQDFTENSDIDWSKPVADIDQQLYKKYGLSQEEITFIETYVKEIE